jgi:hypothetical protein
MIIGCVVVEKLGENINHIFDWYNNVVNDENNTLNFYIYMCVCVTCKVQVKSYICTHVL